MPNDILYLGDTTLPAAASYLAGCLHRAGRSFDYVSSAQHLTLADVADPHRLYILSDYPAASLPFSVQEQLIRHVWEGANFLMIGGWESFHGLGGNWDTTPIGEILPAAISASDDRQNCDSPVFLKPQREHPITENLPWLERSPMIGGYNRVFPRPDAQVLLTAERYLAAFQGGEYCLTHLSSDPLLLVAEHGWSRIGLLMTDLAPHWVGPFVDWGDERISAQAPGAEAVEVGDLYFQFVKQLVNWIGQFEEP